MRGKLAIFVAFALICSSSPALAQNEWSTDRRARVVEAMKRIEREVKSVKVFSGLRHPPLFTGSLDQEVQKFQQEFPEYRDDLETYVSMALPWYRWPTR